MKISVLKNFITFYSSGNINKLYFCNQLMKSIKSIQLKATFLLIVFSLNTIIGFACAVGLVMEFNSHHHEGEDAIVIETSYHHGKSQHHHNEAVKDHHQSKEEGNCCNDGVMKFAQFDKAIPPSFNSAVHPLFFATFISPFFNIDLLYSFREDASIKYFLLSYHPPIPDIRIAIQSFQI